MKQAWISRIQSLLLHIKLLVAERRNSTNICICSLMVGCWHCWTIARSDWVDWSIMAWHLCLSGNDVSFTISTGQRCRQGTDEMSGKMGRGEEMSYCIARCY